MPHSRNRRHREHPAPDHSLAFGLALTLMLLPACYAEWDLPRCSAAADCPVGFTQCYDGYCLRTPLQGVEKAPLPPGGATDSGVDTATADDSSTTDTLTADISDTHQTNPCADPPPLNFGAVHRVALVTGLDPRIATRNDLVFAVEGSTLFAVSISAHTEAWSTPVGAGARCPVVLDDGAVAVPHDAGLALVSDGPVVEQLPVQGGVPACLALRSDGVLVGIAATGRAFSVAPGGTEASWFSPPTVTLTGAPAVTTEDRVVARTAAGAILVLGLDGAPEAGPIVFPVPVGIDPIARGAGALVGLGPGALVHAISPPWTTPVPINDTYGARSLILPTTDAVHLTSSKGLVSRAEIVPTSTGKWTLDLGGHAGPGIAALPSGVTAVVESDSGTLQALSPSGVIAVSAPLPTSGSLGDSVVLALEGVVVVGTELGGIYIVESPCLTGLAHGAPWPALRGDARSTGRSR